MARKAMADNSGIVIKPKRVKYLVEQETTSVAKQGRGKLVI